MRLLLGLPIRNSDAAEAAITAPIAPPSDDTQTQAIDLIRTTCDYNAWICTDLTTDLVRSLTDRADDPAAFAPKLFPELIVQLKRTCATGETLACTALSEHFQRQASRQNPTSPTPFSDAALCYQNQICATGNDWNACNTFLLAAQRAPTPSTYPTADLLNTADTSCTQGNSLLACLTAARVYSGGAPSLKNPQRAKEIHETLCDKANDDSEDRALCATLYAFSDSQKLFPAPPKPTTPAPAAAPASPDAFAVACTQGSEAACFGAGLRALKLPANTFNAWINQRFVTFDSTLQFTPANANVRPFLGLQDPESADTGALSGAVIEACEDLSDNTCITNILKTACDKDGNATACQETALRSAESESPDYAAARTQLTKTCSASAPHLCTLAGLYTLLELPGAKADIATAIPMLKISCDAKTHPSACTLVGLASLSGTGITKDPAAAAAAFTTACDHHKEPLACFLLADLHTKGTGATKDPEAAKRLNTKACAAGFALACPAPAKAAATADSPRLPQLPKTQ